MSLEQFFRPLRNWRISGSILLFSVGVGGILSTADYLVMKKEIDKTFISYNGNTNTSLTVEQKVDFIVSQPNYQPTNRTIEYARQSIRR